MLIPTAALNAAINIEIPVLSVGMFQIKLPPSNEKGINPLNTFDHSIPFSEKLLLTTTARKQNIINQIIDFIIFSNILIPFLPLP